MRCKRILANKKRCKRDTANSRTSYCWQHAKSRRKYSKKRKSKRYSKKRKTSKRRRQRGGSDKNVSCHKYGQDDISCFITDTNTKATSAYTCIPNRSMNANYDEYYNCSHSQGTKYPCNQIGQTNKTDYYCDNYYNIKECKSNTKTDNTTYNTLYIMFNLDKIAPSVRKSIDNIITTKYASDYLQTSKGKVSPTHVTLAYLRFKKSDENSLKADLCNNKLFPNNTNLKKHIVNLFNKQISGTKTNLALKVTKLVVMGSKPKTRFFAAEFRMTPWLTRIIKQTTRDIDNVLKKSNKYPELCTQFVNIALHASMYKLDNTKNLYATANNFQVLENLTSNNIIYSFKTTDKTKNIKSKQIKTDFIKMSFGGSFDDICYSSRCSPRGTFSNINDIKTKMI